MLDRWLKLFPPITPLVLPSMWLRACACAAVKMYLSLSLSLSLMLDETFVRLVSLFFFFFFFFYFFFFFFFNFLFFFFFFFFLSLFSLFFQQLTQLSYFFFQRTSRFLLTLIPHFRKVYMSYLCCFQEDQLFYLKTCFYLWFYVQFIYPFSLTTSAYRS